MNSTTGDPHYVIAPLPLAAVPVEGSPKSLPVRRIYCVGRNYAEALRWYHMTADQDDPQGEVNVAYMYSHGLGVKQDQRQAVQWAQKAADQKNSIGQFELGWHYACGLGVGQDMAKGEGLIRNSAQQGQAEAREWLSGPKGRAKWSCDRLAEQL